MHQMRQQSTYNHSLYARGAGTPVPTGRTLYAAERITITEHEMLASDGCRPLDASADLRLLVTRRGAALLRRRSQFGAALAAEPLQALVLQPGMAYTLEASDAGHAFTIVAYRRGGESSAVPACVEPHVGAPALHALLDAHLLMSFHRLRQTLGAVGADHGRSSAAAELEALTLLAGVCDSYHRRLTSSPGVVRRYRPRARRGDVVERARCTLASAPGDVHALDELSARLGVSTSQLAHVFPQETGLSPHQYLLHLRAALALGELSAGTGDLSRLALELGFATHSHFSAAFRRCMGMPPSEARQTLAARGDPTRPPAWTSSLVRCAYV